MWVKTTLLDRIIDLIINCSTVTSSVLCDETWQNAAASSIKKNYLKKPQMVGSTRKWTLWILPQSSSDTKQRIFCALMCVINFVNSRPVEQTLTTVEAQIRPYIRERRRGDLFQCPLIASSNSLSLSLTCPLFLAILYLLILLHSPEESSLCGDAGSQTVAER